MEVATARVYNWDVVQRRKDKAEGKGGDDEDESAGKGRPGGWTCSQSNKYIPTAMSWPCTFHRPGNKSDISPLGEYIKGDDQLLRLFDLTRLNATDYVLDV